MTNHTVRFPRALRHWGTVTLWLSSRLGLARRRLRTILPVLPEIVTVFAGIFGWTGLVWALADVTGKPAAVWKAGIGLLLLALCGFKLAWKVAMEGVYVWAFREKLLRAARRPPDIIQE